MAELLERVSTAVADMAEETRRTPPSARLTLHVVAAADGERVTVQLLADNYHDTMATAIKVQIFPSVCSPCRYRPECMLSRHPRITLPSISPHQASSYLRHVDMSPPSMAGRSLCTFVCKEYCS